MSVEALVDNPQCHSDGAGALLSDELLACLVRLDGQPSGEDPRHGDRFAQVQAEVSRLSGTDFEVIAEGSRTILGREAKDLRVAGYLCLAAAREGVRGLAAALDLVAALVERFGDDLHPRRPAARDAALRFLAADRIAALVAGGADAGDHEARNELSEAIERLRGIVPATLGIDVSLPGVSEWLRRRAPKPLPVSPEAAPAPRAGTPMPASPTLSLHAGTPADDAELHAATRRLLAYLRESGRWAEHVALSRAYRWAALAAPPAEGGITRVSPPRAAALAAADAACAERRWDDGLAAAERAFLEPGGQFSFRIQRLAAHCAREAGRAALAARIESEVRLVCRALPGLDALRYSDGTAFAEGTDRAWLDRLMATPAVAESGVVPDEEDQLAEARHLLADSGLAPALKALEAKAQAGGRESIRVRLSQARLCLEAERADAARPVLEGILEELRRGGHDLWDRQLTVQALRLLPQATGRDTTQSRADRDRRQAHCRERLAQLDISAALADAGGAHATAP